MKINIIKSIITLTSLILLISCITGKTGPTGPAGPEGQQGLQGPRGLNGSDGQSVTKPPFIGFYRIYNQGSADKAQIYVDSSQYILFTENWNFYLHKNTGDTCNQINKGTIDRGTNTIILTDTTKNTYFYEYDGSYTLKRVLENDILNCEKCRLVPVGGCIFPQYTSK